MKFNKYVKKWTESSYGANCNGNMQNKTDFSGKDFYTFKNSAR